MGYLSEVTETLISADTVSDRGNLAVLAELADQLEGFGFHVRLQRWGEGAGEKANLVAVGGPPEPGGLILSGHVDIVPFADQPGWTRDPLHVEWGEERVYGRGTSDMKGFLAQCMDAARRLRSETLARPLVLLFTADEEIGCLGADRLVPELPLLLDACPQPELAWIGEPTSNRVFHTHKGIVAFRIDVRGRGGHSSVPEAGVNAISVAARVVGVVGRVQAEMRQRRPAEYQRLFPEAPYTSFNFGRIEGGTAANMIAERCSVSVSYRPLPDEDPLAAYERVRERLRDADLGDWGSSLPATLEVGTPLLAPGLEARRGTPLEAALFERLGCKETGGAPFCTDAGHFARAGIDSLICGPGDLDQAHQPDESISRAALEQGTDHILHVVTALCGGDVSD